MIDYLIKLADQLDKHGSYDEADVIDRMILTAGQIPAGMHRFILQRGRFGGSEYDSLNYEESKEINEESEEEEEE